MTWEGSPPWLIEHPVDVSTFGDNDEYTVEFHRHWYGYGVQPERHHGQHWLGDAASIDALKALLSEALLPVDDLLASFPMHVDRCPCIPSGSRSTTT